MADSSYLVLRKLGLSTMAMRCYQILFEEGGTDAAQLAKHLTKSRTGLYRVLNELEERGFITKLKTDGQPAYFFAQPLAKALEAQANYQSRIAAQLIKEQKDLLASRSGN